MRLIDADDFRNRMYHEAFEKDSDLRKWDSGCWIRYKLFENVLREQPSAQPEPKWIPCSERLPEAKQRVLVTFPDGTVDIKICIDAGHLKWFFAHMIAWMPLPEPYDYNYERAVEQLEHDILYESTFNKDDGSM